MPVMTIRLSRQESARIARLSKQRKVNRSELVRQALAALEAHQERSALDELGELVGAIKNGPRDLATNPKHLKGFGE